MGHDFNPKPNRTDICVQCGLPEGDARHAPPPPSETMIVGCARCGHKFDLLSGEGFASCSLIPDDGEGWMSPNFKQARLCADCRDELKSWMGVLPDGADPSLVRQHYPQIWGK